MDRNGDRCLAVCLSPRPLGEPLVATPGPVDTGATESVYEGDLQQRRADGGTYTCTYQGCSLQFDTLERQQDHKRTHQHLQLAVWPPLLQPTPPENREALRLGTKI